MMVRECDVRVLKITEQAAISGRPRVLSFHRRAPAGHAGAADARLLRRPGGGISVRVPTTIALRGRRGR